jgi:hypothetical protein
MHNMYLQRLEKWIQAFGKASILRDPFLIWLGIDRPVRIG